MQSLNPEVREATNQLVENNYRKKGDQGTVSIESLVDVDVSRTNEAIMDAEALERKLKREYGIGEQELQEAIA